MHTLVFFLVAHCEEWPSVAFNDMGWIHMYNHMYLYFLIGSDVRKQRIVE